MGGAVIGEAGPADLDACRELFTEYKSSLAADSAFKSFDAELEGLPGEYAPPSGRLLIARVGGKPAACVAMRRLDDGDCEMKRMYVRPEFRGLGLGRELSVRLISHAKAAGYRRMLLDTLPQLATALVLYRKLGFRPIGRYNDNAYPGVVFFALDL